MEGRRGEEKEARVAQSIGLCHYDELCDYKSQTLLEESIRSLGKSCSSSPGSNDLNQMGRGAQLFYNRT